MTYLKYSASLGLLLLASSVSAGTVTSDGADLVIKTRGGLSVETVDEQYSMQLGGRLMWDYNYSDGASDPLDNEDDFSLRRARIYVKGNAQDWSYKAQFNIGNSNGGTPEDLYIRYNGWGKKAVVTVGKQKEPFGLEALTSSKYISVLERSAITEAYAAGRSEGVLLSGRDGAFTYAAGIFEDDGAANGDDDTVITARATFTPIESDNSVVHLGLAVSQRPDSVDVVGFELAATSGSFHVQTEFMQQDKAGVETDGYYIQAGWILTGESRPYKNGVFKQIKPNDPSGAWEIVARYEDGDGNFSDIELGKTDATAYGLGVNWYLNKNTRLGVNYTQGEDNTNTDDGSEFRARVQFTY